MLTFQDDTVFGNEESLQNKKRAFVFNQEDHHGLQNISLKKETFVTMNDSFIQKSLCDISAKESLPRPDIKQDNSNESNSKVISNVNSLNVQSLQLNLSFTKRKQSKMIIQKVIKKYKAVQQAFSKLVQINR
ncbi:hypothetical protein TTHERM_000083599 (macronuclear) [Tetrahymena thermophila SB210]|uniref:Uncharacterized protein n=1 Tax=Tetrahymena thermophila (strain SB210) TaxID=312017 RepID=W7XJ68_TETTS|nr:hypothetical protein TTHERM_000083599 [Tetrahymena thermophila SB210]EWS75256.1 hypothetical protein TTHERM_000083599 [Tetrahymena thermophila SB210]|eukprot:XP_012652247.1 hypothetical protein TTHERM_000083599 [Tetrahymena thermophila SB210]